jgi:hypothetical protein
MTSPRRSNQAAITINRYIFSDNGALKEVLELTATSALLPT